MKTPKLSSLTFLLFLVSIIFAANAEAQTGYGLTVFNYDNAAGKVYGTSETYLDYGMGYYYNAGVDGYLIKYTDSTLQNYTILDQGSVNDDYDAIVLTEANVQRGETYAVFSDHWVEMTFISGGYYYDPYGLSYNFTEGGAPYYGFQIYQPAYIYQEWVYMGQTGVIVSLPNIIQISPTGGVPGTNILVQIEGKYIGEHTGQFPTVSVSGSGITAQVQNTTPTGVEAIFQIAENADIGDHNVSLTSDGVPSNSVVFKVGDRSPAITSITPPEGNTGESVSVTISGSNFGVNPQVQIDGTGVQPTVISATADQINAVFSIADLTYIGNRNVTIKSNGYSGTGFVLAPGNSDTSNAAEFEVFKPTISIEPFNSLEKNGKRDIKITIVGAKTNSEFRAYIQQGQYVGGVVFEENGQAGIDLIGNGEKVKTIKSQGFASSSLNDWKLTVEGSGAEPKTQNFTVSSVKFEEENSCTGFDDTETPNPYLMVPQNGTNKVKAKIIPEGATGSFSLSGLEQNGVTASPNTITTGEQVITVTAGSTPGDFSLQAMGSGATTAASILKTAVKKRIDKTIVIHAVTEDNDDEQIIPVGQGSPNEVAIKPATYSLQSTPQGDDQKVAKPGTDIYVITTGSNGIRETPLSGNDVEVIPMNQGRSNSACVMYGSNQFRDTKTDSNNDDQVTEILGFEYISSGDDGICQTTANNTDIVPNETDIPNAQSLQDYLNNVTWGRQANVFFTVTRDPDAHQVNFDLNRDGLLSSQEPGDEPIAIDTEVHDNSKDYNFYFLGTNILAIPGVGTPNAFSNVSFKATWFSPKYYRPRVNQAAHETGHLLEGRGSGTEFPEDLMYEYDLPSINPCRIRKRDWDLIDATNP